MHGKYYIFFVCLISLIITLSVKSQELCETPNGDTASCISVYDCKHFVKAIRNRNPSQLAFIKESQCGYDSTPLVCCGPAVDFASKTFTRNSAIPDRKTCGIQKSDTGVARYIFGGMETKLKEFPWMALLGYTDLYGDLKWPCGGTLINSRYILTAAHCVTGEVLRVVGKLSYVKLGEHNVKTEIDCDKQRNCNKPPVIAGVESSIFHEKYDPEDKTSANDIALIRLNKRITYTDFIRPICLPEPNESSAVGDTLTTAGWGLTENRTNSDYLLKVEVPYNDNEKCNNAFKYSGVTLLDSQLCAGGDANRDSCSGDSGGPIMARTTANTRQWYQEGIVSFGDTRCGIEGLPGVYTKVSSFLPWIHKHVRN